MLRRRRSFAHAKRQAMASLVIQKSLLQWWALRDGHTGQGQGQGQGPGQGVPHMHTAAAAATGAMAGVGQSPAAPEGRKRKDR